MPIDNGNLALKGLDDLFSTEEKRQEEQREQVQQIPIDALHSPWNPCRNSRNHRLPLCFPPSEVCFASSEVILAKELSYKHLFQHFLSSHSSPMPRYTSMSMIPSPLTSTRSSKGTTVSPTCKVRNTGSMRSAFPVRVR